LSKNYYEILGVDKAAEPEDIKKAFRALSMEHHPDKGGDEEKFKEINEAYSTLSNPKKRADYDNPMRQMGGFPFSDMFGGGFGRRQQRPDFEAPRRGQNIMMEHSLPVHYFIFGGKFKVNFSFRDACPDCSGTGAEEKETCTDCSGQGRTIRVQHVQGMTMRSEQACPKCMGRGFTAKKQCGACKGSATREIDKNVTLEVPKNIREGSVIGSVGQGHIGLNGGPNGDLVVKLYMALPKAENLTEGQKTMLEGLYE
jgi:molecular chaperone DnaJ